LTIQDGGVRHLEKSKNHHISAAVRAISTKFGTVKQFDIVYASDHYKFKIFKIQDGGGRQLKNPKKRDISATVQAIATKFCTMTQFDPLERSDG